MNDTTELREAAKVGMNGRAEIVVEPADQPLMHYDTSNAKPTPEEVDFAEQFAHYATRIRFDVHHRPVKHIPHDTDPEMLYRFPGRLRLRTSDRTFEITMWPGSTRVDVERMEDLVSEVKEGLMGHIAFTECTGEEGSVYWWLCPGFPVYRDQPVESLPYFVSACTDGDCDSEVHYSEDDWVLHQKDLGFESVHLEREVDADKDADWVLSGSDWETFTAQEAINFANDLQWAAAECKKLNEKRTLR